MKSSALKYDDSGHCYLALFHHFVPIRDDGGKVGIYCTYCDYMLFEHVSNTHVTPSRELIRANSPPSEEFGRPILEKDRFLTAVDNCKLPCLDQPLTRILGIIALGSHIFGLTSHSTFGWILFNSIQWYTSLQSPGLGM